MIHYWYATLATMQAEEAAAEPQLKTLWVLGAIVALLGAMVKRKSCPPGPLAATVVLSGMALLYGMGSPLQTWVDSGVSVVWTNFGDWLTSLRMWALLFGVLSFLLMMPLGTRRQYSQGIFAGIISLGFLASDLPGFTDVGGQVVFWILAIVTLVSAAATVSMRSPVYSAIWFALSLLGTAGLFFYQGSQFLGVATIVVYAGAIVVTFLFVVMLAQPEGHATYDRLSWGRLPKVLSVVVSSLLVACLTYAVTGAGAQRAAVVAAADQLKDRSLADIVAVALDDEGLSVTVRGAASEAELQQSAAQLSELLKRPVSLQPLKDEEDVLHESHMARLGAVMFTHQLLSVELAGTLLLVALVGAIAMAIQGKNEELPAGPHGTQAVTEEAS